MKKEMEGEKGGGGRIGHVSYYNTTTLANLIPPITSLRNTESTTHRYGACNRTGNDTKRLITTNPHHPYTQSLLISTAVSSGGGHCARHCSHNHHHIHHSLTRVTIASRGEKNRTCTHLP